jgi:hypothetical protein
MTTGNHVADGDESKHYEDGIEFRSTANMTPEERELYLLEDDIIKFIETAEISGELYQYAFDRLVRSGDIGHYNSDDCHDLIEAYIQGLYKNI